MRLYGRREFLKAAGLVLAASSVGMLSGCGDSGGSGNAPADNGNNSGSDNSDNTENGNNGGNDPDKEGWVVNSAGELASCTVPKSGTVTLPSKLGEQPITTIASSFALNSTSFNPTKLIIPDGITKIGYSAFQGVSALKQVSLPSTLTFMDGAAFHSCENLAEINFPPLLKTISRHTFYTCKMLKKIVLPDGLTTIELQAFAYCQNLTTVYIPKSITSIGPRAFVQSKGSEKLSEIYYQGTEEDWEALKKNIDSSNEVLLSLTPIYGAKL